MKPQILIVDESLTVRMDLGEALQAAGFDTVLCADIRSAREALAHERASLIILDVLLPDGNGLDFLETLRRSPTTAQVPVLLLSTKEEVKNRVQILDAGTVAFIDKPYELAELVAQAHELTQFNANGDAAIYAVTGAGLLGAKRLLAVDDSVTYLQELASQLREENYVVILASSGEEALELLATEPVDGILLDLIMPGLSGHEACKRIKQRAKWRDIPLIMLTAHDDRDAMIECINAGADDYIAKSADFEVLKVRLRAHLRRKHFEDENHRIREKLVRSETEAAARIELDAEREKLDQRLRDHQFYTRSLFESNIDALMTTDPSGIITDVNHQMEELTECTRDELIGAPFSRYFTDPERAEASIKLVLINKKLTNYELTVRARGGKETVVSFNTATFYDRYRNLQGVFSAARDITERKLFDQVLLQKNVELENAKSVAEKANLAKSDFLSSMSHELRTPLNAILGFTQLIECGTPVPTPAQQQNLEEVLKAGWYLLELINEILDLAQMESGDVTVSLAQEAEKRGIRMAAPRLSALLPAVLEAGHVPLLRPTVPDGTPVRTLLYVEDSPANLELVEQLIARRPDLRLLTAVDGNLGIEFARGYQPDVILMDINLPGISGLEAMKILRADPSTAHIPIIAISANALPQEVEKAIQAGFFKYMTKPFKVIEFMETLDFALNLSQTASRPAGHPAG
jgi:PAS domain S-box-containing protein